MPMTTIYSLPPEIIQAFNSSLLAMSCPKLYDDSETLHRIYKYISEELIPKCVGHNGWEEKITKLQYKFLDIYERIKAKEKEFEEKTGNKLKKSFYFFREANRRRPKVFGRLRARSYFY
jgi:hypothetical protein